MARGGTCVERHGLAVEGLFQSCGGDSGLRTTGWQQSSCGMGNESGRLVQ